MKKIDAALLKVQGELGRIDKSATNPHFKSKYTKLCDMIAAVKPTLQKHGLYLRFPIRSTTSCSQEGKVTVITTLLCLITHAESGDTVESHMIMDPAKIVNPHKVGGEITYCSRYTLASLLALELTDTDDDGNAAAGLPAPSIDTDW